jgi:non-heme chloroperoxidase
VAARHDRPDSSLSSQLRMTISGGFGLKRILVFIAIVSLSSAVTAATFKTSDGISLHYLDAGSGRAIVLVPGWTMAADIFQPQIDGLAARFRVVALDPRSQGDSDKVADGNQLERHAQDIKELLDQLHLHNVVLLGWSNGVPEVLSFVDRYGTADVNGIVLVDGFLDVSSAQIQKALAGMLNSFQADRRAFTDGFIRSMYKTKQTESYIQHVEAQSLKTPTNTAIVELFNVVSRGDFTPILAKIDKPVLYVCETQLESQGKLLQQRLPQARVEVFKDAGHAIFVDEPERFNKLIADFVDSTNPPKK